MSYDRNDFVTCELVAQVNGGTIIFDLLGGDGVYLEKWEPKRPLLKGGGIFHDSPMTDGRRFIFGRKGNTVEDLVLTYVNDTPEGAVFDDRKLISILELAFSQGEHTWGDVLVYWKIKTKGTNAIEQYAKIEFDELKNGQNPFINPFVQPQGSSVWAGINMQLEHGFWGPDIPSEGTAVAIGAAMTYNGQDFGNVDSNGDIDPVTDGEAVFLANYHTHNNITNVHIGTAGANLLGTAGDYNILSNASPLYIGMSASVSGYGPFSNIIFNLTTAGTGSPIISYSYWNGSIWTSLTTHTRGMVQDFKETGTFRVYWFQPSNWVTNSPGGGLPTGYWIRISVGGSGFTVVPQQNGNPYSVTWPYFEIQSDQIGGDLPALAQIKTVYDGIEIFDGPGSFVYGLRSVSRGDNFTAFLNYSSSHNPSGVTISGGTSQADLNSPTGIRRGWSPGSEGDTISLRHILAASIAPEYAGRFKAYLLYRTSDDGEEYFTASIRVVAGDREVQGTSALAQIPPLDLGEIIIPSDPVTGLNGIIITVSPVATSAAVGKSVYFYSLCLIPVDENAMVGTDLYNVEDAGVSYTTDIDSINQRRSVLLSSRFTATNALTQYGSPISNGPVIFQKSTKQRAWFLQNQDVDDSDTIRSVMHATANKHERYNMFVGKGEAV